MTPIYLTVSHSCTLDSSLNVSHMLVLMFQMAGEIAKDGSCDRAEGISDVGTEVGAESRLWH